MAVVKLCASKAGSAYANYAESRTYTVDGANRDEIVSNAIKMAYDDGLEHVRITEIDGQRTFGSMM